MESNFSSFLIVAGGTAINAINSLQKNDGGVPRILFGGALFGLICVGLDEASNARLGTMLALLFLLSSFLTHGVKTLEAVNTAIQSLTKG